MLEPTLAGMTQLNKRKMCHEIKVRHYTRGQFVFKVNDKESIAYFILAGKVELYQEESATGTRAQELAKDTEISRQDRKHIASSPIKRVRSR